MKKKAIDVVEDTLMKWPDGWERTRIQDRKPNGSWKNPWNKYRDAVASELQLLGATRVLVSRSTNERMDPGVAVWFSKAKEDFSWQEALGLDSPTPTLDEIDEAYRRKAMPHHPDRGGDVEIFKRLGDHRKHAKAWVLGTHDAAHDYVVPCDRYDEARLNLAALRQAFFAFRQLERVGVPAILERSLGGLKAALTPGGGDAGTTAS